MDRTDLSEALPTSVCRLYGFPEAFILADY